MRKKFTLLIMSAALLLGSGMAWGQVTAYPDDHTTHSITATSFTPDNNFGPGETGTISPIGAGQSPNIGQWVGNMGTYPRNPFNLDDGRITIGGTTNTVATGMNSDGIYSDAYACSGPTRRNGINGAPSPIIPDGTGIRRTTTGIPNYTAITHITVDATTKSLSVPWNLEQFYFLDNPWYYNYYFYELVSGSSHNESFSDSSPCSSSDSHFRVQYTYSNPLGGYRPGEITLLAGSHVRLDGSVNSGISVGAGNHTHSTATLNLPATHYSLMNDGDLDESSIASNGSIDWGTNSGADLGVDAVLGINGNYVPATGIITHASGGTILLGTNTGGQADMVITPTTSSTPNANSWSGNTVYTGTPIGTSGTANVGNYGANTVNLYASNAMFSNVGTSALQIYNRAGCSYDLNFITQPITIAIDNTGDLFIDSYGLTYFNVANTFNATSTTTDAGDTWIRGAKGVTFNNGAHRYTSTDGSTTGGYYKVEATGASCTPGDIITALAAPVYVTQNRTIATATLDWWAANNIETGGNVFFTNNTGTLAPTKWYAGNNIITHEGVYFKHIGEGTTYWNAMQDIITNDTLQFDHSGTPNTVLNGWIKMEASYGDITANNWFDVKINNPSRVSILATNINNVDSGNISFRDSLKFLRMSTPTAGSMTEIIAGNNIRTAMVDYESLNTPLGDSMQIISRMGDVWLGYNNIASGAGTPPSSPPVSYDNNIFTYKIPQTTQGKLLIRSGDDDPGEAVQSNGGNIYFTHIDEQLAKNGLYNTEVSIPFSNWYNCNQAWNTSADYEESGIIGGVGRCRVDASVWSAPDLCSLTGLLYQGFDGELLFDAGTRGNIIINNGADLTFQGGTGNAKFLTRWGDIDMRYPFDVDSMQGSLLFLANSELPNKLKTDNCTCEEKRNNVYLQDFQYKPIQQSGSIFIGADNNIKLQYGGLKGSAWGTNQRDPFFSGDAGYPCGPDYHCDSDSSENKARDLILNFNNNGYTSIDKGGFAAVASDLIDVYKDMIYTGGQGAGMSSVPGYGNLHGESVAGYGLYIKTQANKNNWAHSAFDVEVNACWPPKCDDPCTYPILQNTARVTFHSDARIDAENQRVYIGSPVLETFGNLDLNTFDNKGGKTSITIQTDSLIVHDSLIIDGKLTNFTTWSGLYRDMPIIKLGHHRFTPPFVEDGSVCKPCFIHEQGTGTNAKRSALDTLYVTYRNGASMPRLHTLVADHTVLSFLTDSFDHVKGDPTLNAKFYTDTFKVRNHVELYADKKHERDGHFELISEEQMESKDYAGIYARHLHMEPVSPDCDDYLYSQLWMQDPALDVITSSTFGGYGWIHADVHVEIEATLAPGYASLRTNGDYCHELKAGTLKMQDLRLDKGARLRYSIGHQAGFQDELADCIDVDQITMYGTVNITVEKRCNQKFEEGCYPIIRYNSVAIDTVNLNNLQLETKKIDGYRLSLDTSTPGIVYLCIGEVSLPQISRQILIPETEGVTTKPGFGAHYIASMDNFTFSAKYTTEQPLKVTTNRVADDGKAEELIGKLNANGEYVYVIRKVQQNIVLKFGPDFATGNELIDGRAVWSHNNTVYIRVEKEDIASIYSIAGQLVKRIELPEGSTPVPMERGVYIVTLKDGSVHKVIVK